MLTTEMLMDTIVGSFICKSLKVFSDYFSSKKKMGKTLLDFDQIFTRMS